MGEKRAYTEEFKNFGLKKSTNFFKIRKAVKT